VRAKPTIEPHWESIGVASVRRVSVVADVAKRRATEEIGIHRSESVDGLVELPVGRDLAVCPSNSMSPMVHLEGVRPGVPVVAGGFRLA
jgi:hypothetical protein